MEAKISSIYVNHTPRKKFLSLLDAIPSTQTKKNPARKCGVCTMNSIRKETRYYCSSCPDKPPLRTRLCYRSYHEDKAS